MARKPSVILTPAELKEKATALRGKIKAVKEAITEENKDQRARTKFAKAEALASAKVVKSLNKELTTMQKDLDRVAPKKPRADIAR